MNDIKATYGFKMSIKFSLTLGCCNVHWLACSEYTIENVTPPRTTTRTQHMEVPAYGVIII